jgi:hypothetical protein
MVMLPVWAEALIEWVARRSTVTPVIVLLPLLEFALTA